MAARTNKPKRKNAKIRGKAGDERLPAPQTGSIMRSACTDSSSLPRQEESEPIPAPPDAEPNPAPPDAEPIPAPPDAEPIPAPPDAEPNPAPPDAEPIPAPPDAAWNRVALSGKSLAEIESCVQELGLPAFRARQIHSWIYAKWARSFEEMTDLSRNVREKLSKIAQVPLLELAHLEVSSDGTRKYLFRLPDGQYVESVLMSFEDRPSLSACVSSQVGCAVGCTFCATGYLGFKRNLTAQEIIDQVLSIQRESGQRVGNIVYMGQGEPLLNTEEVIKSLNILIDSVGIGQRHITVSTSGVVPGILRLAEEELQITLALSLHAPDTATREQIVPITRKYPIAELVDALRTYQSRTGRRLTIEYVLLAGVTDTAQQAKELAELVRDLNCNINLIPYNPTRNPDGAVVYGRPSLEAQQRFKRIAESTGKTVTIRLERGTDINAACGQLHNAYQQTSYRFKGKVID